jgi:hypothetical protein
MTDADDKVGLTVRVIVKLRPEEYDELFRHVRRIGSTMSAFFALVVPANITLPGPVRSFFVTRPPLRLDRSRAHSERQSSTR